MNGVKNDAVASPDRLLAYLPLIVTVTLSFRPVKGLGILNVLVGRGGFEPPTNRLKVLAALSLNQTLADVQPNVTKGTNNVTRACQVTIASRRHLPMHCYPVSPLTQENSQVINDNERRKDGVDDQPFSQITAIREVS